ncbi:MAG: adenylyltransferase/cytidyltransferase family protein [Bacteroidales bacterium]|jgi:riboflavin kinase/FMN adenylyltransferase
MKIFRSFEDARGLRNPVVTTGSFDGVHIGHKTILNRLRMLANKYDGESVLITFHPHPRKVLYPETAGRDLKLINSQEEKIMLLEKAGLDNVIIIEFTQAFAKTTSEEFVRNYLSGILKARVVVAGFNHHFGFNKEGDYRQLWTMREKYGFEAEEIPEQEVEHESVSSTRIRTAIRDGYIQRANAYLDHYYLILGKPVTADPAPSGSSLPFLSMPVTDENKLLPSDGIYAVSSETGSALKKGMVVINTMFNSQPRVFLHLIDNNPDITGRSTSLLFRKKITGPVNLNDLSAAQLKFRSAAEEISDLVY